MGKKTVSFLVSGRGSNFTAVAEKILNNEINAKLGIVISNNSDAKALEIADNFGMKSFFSRWGRGVMLKRERNYEYRTRNVDVRRLRKSYIIDQCSKIKAV